MITFDKDGVTLIGYDANGTQFKHNFLEGALYDAMLNTRDAQLAAAIANSQNASNYTTVITGINLSEQAGRPHDPPPAPPQEKNIDDLGNVSFAAFVPALTPYTPLVVTAPSGSIVTVVPDKQAIMYNMILAMFRKEFPGV